jgi:hypothetical protein
VRCTRNRRACLDLDDLARRAEARVAQHGVHLVQVGIAVGSIHPRVKLGVKRKLAAECRQPEIRNRGLAIHLKVAERSAIRSL